MAILHFVKKYTKISLVGVAFVLSTCAPGEFEKNAEKVVRDPIDWKADLTRNEIRDALRPERQKAKERTALEEDSSIPPLASTVLAPDAPEINSTKKISLSITETVDLKDVLQELARLAELELALDPNISGGIILSVQNRNIGEVLEMVADLADLKYSIDNGILKVVRDHPYLVHYNVDYLNLVRSSKGSIDTKTSTGSTSGGGSGGSSSSSSSSSSSGSGSGSASSGSITSGSSNSISSEYDGDLWGAVEKNIESIVKSESASIKKDTSTIISEDDESSSDVTTIGDGSSYSVNKQAGIISVLTTFRKHKSIQSFLDRVMNNSSAQVLIEAKIIEVKLREDYATGINWSRIAGANWEISPVHQVTNTVDKLPTGILAGTVAADKLNFFKPNKSNSVSGFMEFLQGFGVTRTLSNPRVTIINNQQAVLTFATNQPYFSISATPSTTVSTGGTGTTSSSTFTTTLNTVPLGVILAIQPSINSENQEVTLHVRPTLTSKLGDIKDPSIRLNAPRTSTGTIISDLPDNNIPIVQVRELDTVLKAKSGDVMVIGGLIQHIDESGDIGTPFLQEIPILGNLMKQVGKTSNVTETVILMQATIVPPRSNYHKQDKKIYETFTQDPRPLVF